MSSQYPFHKIPHFLRRALLHLAGSVYVGAQCETRVVVAKHVGHRFHIHTVLQSNGRERVLESSKIKQHKQSIFFNLGRKFLQTLTDQNHIY